MITKEIVIRNLTADYPFSGDPKKTWFCEIIGSNLGTDGNPVVNYVANGQINLTALPRQLNAELTVAFHDASETEAVKKFEAISNISTGLPSWGLVLLGKAASVSKRLGVASLMLVIFSMMFAGVNYYFDISGFLSWYQKFNAANGAKVVGTTTAQVMDYFNDPFYETEGIQEIEERYNIDVEKLFVRILANDAGSIMYVMKDLILDEDGNPKLIPYDDAENYCDDLGGFVLDLDAQKVIYSLKKYLTLSAWNDVPEWTSTGKSWASDDYAINLKSAAMMNGGYQDEGVVFADGDDINIGARCAILRDSFIEEQP